MNRDYDRRYESNGRIDDVNFNPEIAAYNLEMTRLYYEDMRSPSSGIIFNLIFSLIKYIFMHTKKGKRTEEEAEYLTLALFIFIAFIIVVAGICFFI